MDYILQTLARWTAKRGSGQVTPAFLGERACCAAPLQPPRDAGDWGSQNTRVLPQQGAHYDNPDSWTLHLRNKCEWQKNASLLLICKHMGHHPPTP